VVRLMMLNGRSIGLGWQHGRTPADIPVRGWGRQSLGRAVQGCASLDKLGRRRYWGRHL